MIISSPLTSALLTFKGFPQHLNKVDHCLQIAYKYILYSNTYTSSLQIILVCIIHRGKNHKNIVCLSVSIPNTEILVYLSVCLSPFQTWKKINTKHLIHVYLTLLFFSAKFLYKESSSVVIFHSKKTLWILFS